MAHKAVTLMVYGKTDEGWKRLHVIVGRNGKIKPGFGRAKANDTSEIRYTQGHYELRTYKGTRVQYENVGTDPSEAIQKSKNHNVTLAVREGVRSFAEEAGIVLPDSPTKSKPIDLRAKGKEFLSDLEDRGKARAAELWIPTLDGFIDATGVTEAGEITSQSVLDYHKALRRRGNEDRTIYNRHVSLFQFFSWIGLDTKKLAKRPPTYTEREVETYSPAQIKALLNACRTDYDRVVFNLLLKTGLRMSEAIHLAWPQIDFDTKVIRVREKRQAGKKIKDRAERSVPMPDDLAGMLSKWRLKNPETKLVIGTKTDQPNDKLLRTLKRVVNAGKLSCGHCDGCNSKSKECGEWYLHKFRATYTTTLLRNGVDPRTVMSYTGHEDFATMMRYLRPAQAETMQEKISSIVWA